MDRSAFFWQVQDGKLPPPRSAATLGISIREISPEAGTIEVEFEGKRWKLAFAPPPAPPARARRGRAPRGRGRGRR